MNIGRVRGYDLTFRRLSMGIYTHAVVPIVTLTLMMEENTIFETLDHNSILMRLIVQGEFAMEASDLTQFLME